MTVKVKKIVLNSGVYVVAEFADGHTMAFEHDYNGYGGKNSPTTITLEKGMGGEVVVRYYSMHSPTNKSVDTVGIKRQVEGYTVERFIEYIKATMEAAHKQGGKLWNEARKAGVEIPELEKLAKKENR
jgi:hypothetical protein